MKLVIWDMDDTLVDTFELLPLRKQRKWDDVYRGIPVKTRLFEGILDTLQLSSGWDQRMAIITHSPRSYAERLLNHHQINFDKIWAYHDLTHRKPHPWSVQEALSHFGVKPGEAVAVGDAKADCQCYRSAGVRALGAGWNPRLETAQWDDVLFHPDELLSHIIPF